MLEALGMIEVTGYLGAISSADAALKAANVTLLRSEKVQGGITTVQLIGDVAAVTAAVDAGKVVAESLGCFRASHVIPRMDIATQAILLDVKEKPVTEKVISESVDKAKEQITAQVEELKAAIVEEVIEKTPAKKKEDKSKEAKKTMKKNNKK